MNWRRGLFRLWIVGTVLFVIAVASINYPSIKAEFDTVAHPPKLVTDPKLIEQLEAAPPDPINFGYLIPTPNPWASVGTAVAIALGIPLAVLALGASLVWAFSGFAVKRH